MGTADATEMRAYVWGRPDVVTLAQFGGQGDLGRLGRRQRVPINLRPHHHSITITSSLHHHYIIITSRQRGLLLEDGNIAPTRSAPTSHLTPCQTGVC